MIWPAYELNGDIKNAAEQLSQVINTTYYNDVANKVDGLQDTILMDVSRMVGEMVPSTSSESLLTSS